jgi:membrane-bound serine protease (ClpP class)
MEIDGAIGPITAEYVRRGFDKAREQDVDLIVLRLDTPGGLDAAMRDIIKEILASPVPVVGFVDPSGARAASAGTYILYACHLAAMAPATTLGSATPVQLGGLPTLPEQPGKQSDDEKKADKEEKDTADNSEQAGDNGKTTMERKIINDAAAFIRGLAQLRGRNAEWAEKAVREAVDLTSAEAEAQQVINLVATDVRDLLKQIDGTTLEVFGEVRSLATEDAEIIRFDPDWRTKLLSAITDPTLAYILLLVGVYGLIYELANPGAMIPGVIGAIALVIALLAFQALPVNYAGLALVVLGIAFMALEAFVPSFGVLGIGGAIAFVVGSVVLYNDDSGQIAVALPVIATFAVLSMVLFIWVLGYAVKTRRKPVVSGREEMLGATGIALRDMTTSGRVRVHSESWNAQTSQPIKQGQTVRVTAIEGLTLTVEPLEEA